MSCFNSRLEHEVKRTKCDKKRLQLSFAAEFVICLAEKHKTFDEFKAVLVENGAEFTVSVKLDKDQSSLFGYFLFGFFLNLCSLFQDTLIANLLRLIQTMRPSPSTSKGPDTVEMM